MLKSSVSYGAETWVSNKEIYGKLEVAETEFRQRTYGLTTACNIRNQVDERRKGGWQTELDKTITMV